MTFSRINTVRRDGNVPAKCVGQNAVCHVLECAMLAITLGIPYSLVHAQAGCPQCTRSAGWGALASPSSLLPRGEDNYPAMNDRGVS